MTSYGSVVFLLDGLWNQAAWVSVFNTATHSLCIISGELLTLCKPVFFSVKWG